MTPLTKAFRFLFLIFCLLLPIGVQAEDPTKKCADVLDKTNTDSLNKTLELILKNQTTMQETLTTLQENQTTMQETQTTMQGTLTTLQENQTTMQGTLNTLQENQTTMQGDIRQIKKDVKEVKTKVTNPLGKMNEGIVAEYLSDIYSDHIFFERKGLLRNVAYSLPPDIQNQEFDIIVLNPTKDKVLFVEVKTILRRDDVLDFLQKIDNYLKRIKDVQYERRHFRIPELDWIEEEERRRDLIEVHGAIALVHDSDFNEGNIRFTLRSNLSALHIIGSTLKIIEPRNFITQPMFYWSKYDPENFVYPPYP